MVPRSRPFSLRVTAAALAVAGLALTGCGADEAAIDAEVEDPGGVALEPPGPYAGAYDAAFAERVVDYAEQEVTLTGEVDVVVSPVAFTITAAGGDPAASLLVVHDPVGDGLTPGAAVTVTGTVHEAYNVPSVEENLGEPPGEDVLAHYDGEPFVDATVVDGDVSQRTAPTG